MTRFFAPDILVTVTAQFYIEDFLASFDSSPSDQPEAGEGGDSLDWCESASEDELYRLLARLAERPAPTAVQDAKMARLFRALLRRDWSDDSDDERLPAWLLGQVALLYQRLGANSLSRAFLLQLIATHGDRELTHVAEWLIADPPQDVKSVLVAFAPLFQRRDFNPEHLFPRLLDAIAHPTLAASVIDLANFVTKEGLVDRHPATERIERLVGLLGSLTHRLTQLEEALGSQPGNAAELALAVEESVSLAVAICHALALIGDEVAVGKLFQTLELRHRRLRTEAAAALAVLQQPAGAEALAELAAEPIVRLRVLAYANELDCLDQIDEQFQTGESRAEAELALWLAQPSQIGMPPTTLERVDTRSQYWPGFDDEVDCFLFRFSYQLAEGEFSNIGIAGPLTHAFHADIADLSLDDIYASFAGWQAEHEDIYEIDIAEAHEAHGSDIARFERRLHDEGYQEIRSLRLGLFFGDRALVARAKRSGVEGIAVVDLDAVQWRSTEKRARPVGVDEMYYIYKGRKLLRNFNE
jgi:hypothetical protein